MIGPSTAKAQTETSGARIDASSPFAPPRGLEFPEKIEAMRFPLDGAVQEEAALTDIYVRLAAFDANRIDINILVRVPWIDDAAKITNNELAAAIALNPQRFRGVVILPGATQTFASVLERHRCIAAGQVT